MSEHAMTHEAFVVLTSGTKWASTEELVDTLDAAEFWSEDWLDGATMTAKKIWLRKNIRQVKDLTGFPVFASIVTVDEETGEHIRVYKQEAIFETDDYRQTSQYHLDRAMYHVELAYGYKERGEQRYGMQIQLKLPISEILGLAAD